MSSMINGLNDRSFQNITQQATSPAHRRGQHHDHHHADATSAAEGSPETRINQRSLHRAQRDVTLTLRGVNREAIRLLDRVGSNTDVADKVKQLAADFEQALNDRFDAFAQGGAQNYLGFAEETAAARRDFRAQLRDISRGLEDSTTTGTTDTVDLSTGNTSGTNTNVTDVTATQIDQGTGQTGSTATDRAQRDIDALNRGLDREFERFNRTFGTNPDAVAKFNKMRAGFIDAVKKEYDSLAQGSTASYIDFAERVASMRQGLARDLRSTFGDPSNSGTTGSEGSGHDDDHDDHDADEMKINTRASGGGGTTTTDATATSTDRTGTTDTSAPNTRNIERAKHDAELLLRGLDRDSNRLTNAMGDSPEARQIIARANDFRSMLEERLKQFVDGGGTDYLGFAEQMASARRSVSTFFSRMAGPKLDRLG
jgi:hypothetical protein